MKGKYIISIFIFLTTLIGCTKEYDCIDSQIQPAFIRFSPTDIDTFVIRKFIAGNNYQNLIDTVIVKFGYNGLYRTSGDTTSVFVNDGKNGIKAGYDWQVFIPSKNKTVLISEIASEKKTEKRGTGIFSLDPGDPCVNLIYSAKLDNQAVYFSNSDTSRHNIFIRH